MSKADDKMKGLSIDRAAFILLRVKRVFKKKKQQLHDKNISGEIKALNVTKPPPLLRSRTLPSIVVPGLNILQAQIDAKYKSGGQGENTQKNIGGYQPFSDDTLHGNRNLVYHRLSTPEPSGPNGADAFKNYSAPHFLALPNLAGSQATLL